MLRDRAVVACAQTALEPFGGPERATKHLLLPLIDRAAQLAFSSSLTAGTNHIGLRDEIEPFSRIGSKLLQFRREIAQREKDVARLVPPVGLGQAGDLRLQFA